MEKSSFAFPGLQKHGRYHSLEKEKTGVEERHQRKKERDSPENSELIKPSFILKGQNVAPTVHSIL